MVSNGVIIFHLRRCTVRDYVEDEVSLRVKKFYDKSINVE